MKTRRKLIIAALVCFTSGIVASAQPDRTADPPYAWILNLTNSDFDETTDGKNYPSLFGGTSAWKQINGMTWEIPIKQDGKLINTTRRRARILESTVYVSSDAHIQLAPPRTAKKTTNEQATVDRSAGNIRRAYPVRAGYCRRDTSPHTVKFFTVDTDVKIGGFYWMPGEVASSTTP